MRDARQQTVTRGLTANPRWDVSCALVLSLTLASFSSAAHAQGSGSSGRPAGGPPGFLTAPAPGDPLDLALAYLRENRVALGLEAADLDDWILTDRTRSRHNGLTHLYLRQRLAGIDVIGGELSVSVTSDGRLIALRNHFVPGLARAVNARAPTVSQSDAVQAAATHLGLTVTTPLSEQQNPGGPTREVLLSDGGISLDPIPVKLAYLSDGDGGARLVWNLFVRTRDQQHWWSLNVDVVTGAVLSQTDWILNDSYRVFPPPLESPSDGPRSLEVDPADATASPYAWHDTNGAAGAEVTDTRGNNVNAQDDVDGNNSGGFRPSGGGSLQFDFPLDLTQPPASSQAAAITNLYYWNNWLHDVHYAYGFDEISGNYQVNNYGNGGNGGDPILADAQDGSGLNNANFSRAPDGSSSRMQMFLFQFPGARINSPAAIAGSIAGGGAQFGPPLTSAGTTGDVVQALDPPDAPGLSSTDGCSPLTNGANVAGKIALIDRGDCTFVDKVNHAQAVGAIAAIIVNDDGDEVIPMGGSDPASMIPSLFIGQTHGDQIKAQLGAGVNVTLSSAVQRDGDLDNGIIIHEYGHGVSIRLSGGPSSVGCLGLAQSAGMGEGWGDWWALALTAKLTDTGADARGIGTYALGEAPGGPGIRNFPYSTDPLVNPQTLSSIDGTNQPHGVGEIWAQALWEVYWNLVGAHGFDPDLISGSGGNNLALQIAMDALKLQSCDPTFLAARDAILGADMVLTGGANECLLWQAFAKRGMGVDADDTGNPRRTRATDGFALPEGCEPACGNGVTEPGEQCDDGGAADGDCCSSTCQIEAAGGECRAVADVCDVAEACDGVSPTCPDDVFASATSECRSTADVCDMAELCTGSDPACPADAFASDTTVCRAAADVCDAAELCSGASASCPADAFEPTTIVCRPSAGVCDLPDSCAGDDPACPADAKSGAECRAAGGSCDVAESCDGVSDACPADQVDPGLCADGDPCTVEACVSLECEIRVVLNGTPCLDGTVCNGAESCQAGTCSAGGALDCDDGHPCTADGCDAVTGCLNDPIPGCLAAPDIPALPRPGLLLLAGLLASAGIAAAFGTARR